MSKGEDKIISILKSARIPFEREYTFPDLKYKGHLLRYDFAILSGGRPIKLIEFDGQQHFKFTKHFGDYSTFKHMQENDRRKNRYALAHFIPLIRIPYWDLDSLSLNFLVERKYIVNSISHNDYLSPP